MIEWKWLTDEQAKAICLHRAKTNSFIRDQIAKGKVPRAVWTRWAHEYDAARTIIRTVAGRCDGAKSHDHTGFNKHDSKLGKELSQLPEFTNEQFWQAVRLSKKYYRQVEYRFVSWLPCGPGINRRGNSNHCE